MKLEIVKEQKEELLEILSMLQPKIGFGGDSIIRAISLYFGKYYQTELGFSEELGDGNRNFISRDKCIIRDGKREFTVGQVMRELMDDEKILSDRTIQAEDVHGNKLWFGEGNKIPRMLHLYKINK